MCNRTAISALSVSLYSFFICSFVLYMFLQATNLNVSVEVSNGDWIVVSVSWLAFHYVPIIIKSVQ